ncbi:MAG: DEAD/DEAH box helicase [Pseudomonadota bacterium]
MPNSVRALPVIPVWPGHGHIIEGEPTTAAVDKLLHHARLWARQTFRYGLLGRPLKHSVRRTRNHISRLAKQSDAQLADRLVAQRRDLRRHGLTSASAETTLALVAEIAARRCGLAAFDVQLLGSLGILNGLLLEMQTGEGKTLTAALAAATAGVAGIPVHVITSNAYLANRDMNEMKDLADGVGLALGHPHEGASRDELRAAYRADVVFATSKQIAFDYLRDRHAFGDDIDRYQGAAMRLCTPASGDGGPVMRGLHMAIIDEADSSLVDEARTPLILSQQGDDLEQAELAGHATTIARELETGTHVVLGETDRRVRLTPAGSRRAEELARDRHPLLKMRRRREELVEQALHALHVLRRDHEYVVLDDKVRLIDEFTGRIMADRTLGAGLHQMVEVKEQCPPTPTTNTLAQITFQRFFRRYSHLSGMTGTAQEVEAEFWTVYGLAMMRVPPRRRNRRIVKPACVMATRAHKLDRIVQRIAAFQKSGQPVLVGVTTVAASNDLSRRLSDIGLTHNVLNAVHHEQEAEIIAEAGFTGRVTIATNMAGRGTDIKLGPGASALGGLAVLITERHEARRIDRQLVGRCARQGDPGLVEAYLSLEDTLVAQSHWAGFANILKWPLRTRVWPMRWLAEQAITRAQRDLERRSAQERAACLDQDRQLADLLAFAGPPE